MLPDDLILNAADDVAIRKDLTLTALAKRPADLAIRVGRLLNVYSRTWAEDQEIVIKGRRIAYVGPAGSYRGEVARRVHYPDLSAVPGFGEVHKHIESSHLTPEFEAELVLPRGNTWTCEASHEFANVNGGRNTEFWQRARERGVPHKVFIQPGSAVPPSGWETSGGYYGYAEQRDFLARDLSVVSLDEVMDWPAVWNPENPSYERLWGMMQATIEKRGVIEGHGSGLVEPHDASAYAAAGLSSDHEVWTLDEAWEKLNRGVFIEIRPFNYPEVLPGLIERGLSDWSNVAFTTDDRSASETLKLGASDYNVRAAIAHGVPPEIAYQCVTIHPARHMRIDAWVGSITPGRYADIVLLNSIDDVGIAHVYADGQLVSEGKTYLGNRVAIDWPDWARQTMNIGRSLTAADFAVPALPGRATMQAAVLRPFHWNQEFMTYELAVADGAVQRDTARRITKFSVIDRYHGKANMASMFWLGCGPADAETALACSVAHDSHNVWAIGSSDAAMALAVNRLAENGGGWVLVHGGEVTGEVVFEIGGLMTARPAEVLDADMQRFYRAAEQVDWMYEPSVNKNWIPGFPEHLIFATLTCAPWRWVLVAPHEKAPDGFVNVQTGETHKIVW
ncbi:adenine deaminase [Rhizobium sp. C4]|uniref:adenine deaminase n=1 Tax=Rhizobium sp. C4 TaxID=1349800 RepID=UPI001E55A91D|nr:adenine deaminase C-terminal domain-containing protein [Rhizobium sp. C4]MCD2172565.1 amidohydrolase family protein [Rhizobium sp. C4]